jgi:hypothetical protein
MRVFASIYRFSHSSTSLRSSLFHSTAVSTQGSLSQMARAARSSSRPHSALPRPTKVAGAGEWRSPIVFSQITIKTRSLAPNKRTRGRTAGRPDPHPLFLFSSPSFFFCKARQLVGFVFFATLYVHLVLPASAFRCPRQPNRPLHCLARAR